MLAGSRICPDAIAAKSRYAATRYALDCRLRHGWFPAHNAEAPPALLAIFTATRHAATMPSLFRQRYAARASGCHQTREIHSWPENTTYPLAASRGHIRVCRQLLSLRHHAAVRP